jgi:uncharacterized protein YfdQ (DUF2303 family)
MLTEDALKYIRALDGATTIAEPDNVYPSEVVAVPDKSRLESLEKYQLAPNRIQHKAQLAASSAFIAYVNRFKTAETSIYLDLAGDESKFVAVLDHHGPGAPSWSGHRAVFTPAFSLEWKAWKQLHSRGAFRQADLLAFMEDHAGDLHEPTPAHMLTALGKFEQVEKHTYQSGINLDNGTVQLTYTKDAQTRKVEFPHSVQLYIPVLENEASTFVDGRLRFKTSEGAVAFTFQLKVDPERVERDSLRRIATAIKAQCEGCHLYEGEIL